MRLRPRTNVGGTEAWDWLTFWGEQAMAETRMEAARRRLAEKDRADRARRIRRRLRELEPEVREEILAEALRATEAELGRTVGPGLAATIGSPD